MKLNRNSLLLAIFLLGILPQSVGYQGRKGHGIAERTNYKTGYACEGSILHLNCDEGSVIHVVRANYGRFTISICNPRGVLEWTVKCMSTRSMRVMIEKCHLQRNCSVPARNFFFGDPCKGTVKYLEAKYYCEADVSLPASQATTPTLSVEPAVTPPVPEILPDDTTPVSTTSTAEPESTTAIRITTLHTVPFPTNVSVYPPAHHAVFHHSSTEDVLSTSISTSTPSTTEIPSTTTTTTEKPTTPSTTTTMGPRYCEPVKARGILWNRTLSGKIVTHPCPHPSRGMAQWTCDANPVRWYPDTPDLSNCLSPWTSQLDSKLENNAEIGDVAMELATKTARVSLFGGDIRALGFILNKMVTKLTEMNLSKEEYFNVSKALMKAGSNLLDISRTQSWTDLSGEDMTKTATSLVMTLENNAFLLAESLNEESLITNTDENIIMGVNVLDAENIIDDVLFPSREKLQGSDWQLTMDSILLPGKTLKSHANHNGLVKLVFFAYNNLGSLLNNHHFELERQSNGKKFVNTRVISATINQRGDMIYLPEPVIIKFEHNKKGNSTNATCVFWNYSENTKLGFWSDHGCDLIASNDLHTICQCHHLTNFAVLMDVRSIEISPENEVALRIITYVGCIISIVCLTLSLITFILFRGLQSDRNTIHKNLCFCLLVAEVLFLVGIGQTDKPVLCAVFAGLLHFFFLSSFAWMFLEGFQLYVMLIEVFESEKSRLRWYYVAAYGCPLLIVAIAASIDHQSYGTPNHCWLKTDNYFIFSFVGPVIVVILANIIFLSIAVCMMCRHANIQTAIKNRDNCKTGNIKAWVRGALVLVFLLGLTWTFGLFYLNEGSTFMAYVFTVLNSLQGLFIFIFHCLRNEKVQKEYKKWVRRTDWLPENWRMRYGGHTGLTASNGTGTPGSGQNSTGHQGGKTNCGLPQPVFPETSEWKET